MLNSECPLCGSKVKADQRFCPLCQAELSTIAPEKVAEKENSKKDIPLLNILKNECPACGARLDREQSLCPICSKG